MKSGLEGRNNPAMAALLLETLLTAVSMKSGLEGRNNSARIISTTAHPVVSMKSGLEGRNNRVHHLRVS